MTEIKYRIRKRKSSGDIIYIAEGSTDCKEWNPVSSFDYFFDTEEGAREKIEWNKEWDKKEKEDEEFGEEIIEV